MSAGAASPPPRSSWLRRAVAAFVGLLERWLSLSCRSFIRRASEALDRPLGPGERVRQTMHRLMCRVCRTQERRMGQLQALARELGTSALDDGRAELSDERAERIRRALDETLKRSSRQ